MQPRKLNIFIATFAYGGNGGVSMIVPQIADWLVETVLKLKADPRVGEVFHETLSDTPITMTRNQSVLRARKAGADVLLMIDSDQLPDYDFKMGFPGTRPFWDTTFDFIYKHYDKGPCVVGAPYCGPSPVNNVYVFQFTSFRNGANDQDLKLAQYNREQAAMMSGIRECAALPTGLIAYDMRIFDIAEPQQEGDQPWFYYEYKDHFQGEKCSTEDVTATRDMALIGLKKLGYCPVYCNWDAWAGHAKPEFIGRPNPVTIDQIGKKYQKAFESGSHSNHKYVVLGEDGQDILKNAIQMPAKQATPAEEITADPERLEEVKYELLKKHDYSTPGEDKEAICAIVRQEAERLGRRPVCMELGTLFAKTSVAMADAGGCVHTVDNLYGAEEDCTQVTYGLFGKDAVVRYRNENIGERMGRTVFPHQGDSALFASLWSKPLDVLFIDADHTYEGCKRDILAWLPRMRDGGVIAGHDFAPEFPGVEQAVREIFGDDFEVTGTVWHTRKISTDKPTLLPAMNTNERIEYIQNHEWSEDVVEVGY